MLRALRILAPWALAALGYANVSIAAGINPHDCDEGGALCTETVDPIGYNGAYTGHDEPSLLFYSNTKGSGNHMTYTLRLPADPPTPPNQLGTGKSELAIVVPLTRTNRPSPLYVGVDPPEGGGRERSYAMPEMVRSISRERLAARWGTVSPATLSAITHRVHLLTRTA